MSENLVKGLSKKKDSDQERAENAVFAQDRKETKGIDEETSFTDKMVKTARVMGKNMAKALGKDL